MESLLSAQNTSTFGIGMQISGMVSQTIGAYYAAQAQRYRARSERLNLEFQGSIADINARAAERDAQDLLAAGQLEKMSATLRYGAVKATSRARIAASGLQAGVGSAAEVQTSIEAAKEIDALTIDRNAVRAANASRMRAVNYRNEALLARVSARNVHDMAHSLSPAFAAFTSLLGSAGPLADSLSQRQL
jgi:hypothetical protein